MSDTTVPFGPTMAEVRRQTEAHLRQHGIEITVIDDSDHVGWRAAATRLGEVSMRDVSSMVKKVLEKKGHYLIRRLNILDHGNAWTMTIGDDEVTMDTLRRYIPELVKLRGQFHASGFVHLQHCEIGMNNELLVRLAAVFGVSVYAVAGFHNPIYRFNTGGYVRADPSGHVYPTDRPGLHVRYLGDTGDFEPTAGPREPRMRFMPRELGVESEGEAAQARLAAESEAAGSQPVGSRARPPPAKSSVPRRAASISGRTARDAARAPATVTRKSSTRSSGPRAVGPGSAMVER